MGKNLAGNGCKAGGYSSGGGSIQQVFAVIRAKSGVIGCLIAVDFREKGFYPPYTFKGLWPAAVPLNPRRHAGLDPASRNTL